MDPSISLSITASFFIYLQYVYLSTYLPISEVCVNLYIPIFLYIISFYHSLFNLFSECFFFLNVKSWPQDKLEQL